MRHTPSKSHDFCDVLQGLPNAMFTIPPVITILIGDIGAMEIPFPNVPVMAGKNGDSGIPQRGFPTCNYKSWTVMGNLIMSGKFDHDRSIFCLHHLNHGFQNGKHPLLWR